MRSYLLGAVVLAVVLSSPLSAQAPNTRFQVLETKVLDLPVGVAPDTVVLSPTQPSAAYPVRSGSKWRVVVDGKPGDLWDEVADLRFVHQGRLAVYSARSGKKWYAVEGPWKSSAYDRIRWDYPEGRTDVAPALFVGTRDGKDHFVVDTQEGPGFDQVHHLFVTSDGASVLYSATDLGPDRLPAKGTVVWGTKTFTYNGEVVGLSWNNAGGQDHTAWAVQEKSRGYVVIDGQNGADFDLVGTLDTWAGVFFYDGKSGSQWHYVLGDQTSPGYSATNVDLLQVSRDGKWLAWEAGEWGHQRTLWNGTPGEEFDEVLSNTLSPDEKTLVTVGTRKGSEYVVVNGVKSGPYEKAGVYLGLSDVRNDRWAYAAQVNRKWHLITNQGRDPQAWDRVEQVFFAADGSLRAVVEKDGQDWVWDGELLTGPSDELTYLRYGPGLSYYGFGGNTLVARVRVGSQVRLVAGTQETPSYDAIPSWSREDQGQLAYWGLRGRTLYRSLLSPVPEVPKSGS